MNNDSPVNPLSLPTHMINRSGFGQRMPDGKIIWSYSGDKKAKQ